MYNNLTTSGMKYKTWRLIFTSLTSTCPNLSAPYYLLLLNRKYYYYMYYLLHTYMQVSDGPGTQNQPHRLGLNGTKLEQSFFLHFLSNVFGQYNMHTQKPNFGVVHETSLM